LIYNAVEQPPPNPPFTPAGWDVAGTRPYGKDRDKKPKTYRHAQRRRAYCAIRRWAISHHYFNPSDDDAVTPEPDNRRNAYPTGNAAWFDSD
jgi:hypothetical protein